MDHIAFEVDDRVGLITLNRPKALNALNSALIDELDAVLIEQADAGLAALIVTGSGDRAFAAGADISEMVDITSEQAEAFSRRGQQVLRRLETFPAPTIAAVKGFALGGGCELAMSCDLVLAAPSAVFGQPEVKLGVIPGFGGTCRTVRRVGRQRALQMMWTGRNVGADEAVRIGLALEVVDEGDVVDAARTLAQRIARNGPVAVSLVKRAVDQAEAHSLTNDLESEAALFGLCFTTSDQKEGMTAFLEKRRAAFTGN